MNSFLGVLIFIVIAILSLAQRFNESRKESEARRAQKSRTKPGEVRTDVRQRMMEGSTGVKVAKAKGAVERAVRSAATPETTGRELIEAMFGEGSADNDDGWEEVHPQHLPVEKQAIPKLPEHQNPNDVRKAALRQREAMEHGRSREHSVHGAHVPGETQEARARRAKANEARKREQVLAERQGRKQEAERQRRAEAEARRGKTKRRNKGVVAPIASGGILPQNLGDVRRAIVMAEILGPPKALQ